MFVSLKEIYKYRELIRNLVLRILRVRYKGSVLGFFWSFLNPLLNLAIYTLVFSIFVKVQTEGIPYPIFVLCGLLPWNFFSISLVVSANSVIENAHLIKKVYFPYEVLPVSAVISGLVNFLFSMVILFIFLYVYNFRVTPYVLYIPIIMLSQIILSVGIAFMLSAVNVFFRDVGNILDVLVLSWFFLTPVFYSSDLQVPARYLKFYYLNPMAAFVVSYRNVLLKSRPPDFAIFGTGFLISVFVFLLGYAVFGYFKKSFSEEL